MVEACGVSSLEKNSGSQGEEKAGKVPSLSIVRGCCWFRAWAAQGVIVMVVVGSRPCNEVRRRMTLSSVVQVSVGAEAASAVEPGRMAKAPIARTTAQSGSSKCFIRFSFFGMLRGAMCTWEQDNRGGWNENGKEGGGFRFLKTGKQVRLRMSKREAGKRWERARREVGEGVAQAGTHRCVWIFLSHSG